MCFAAWSAVCTWREAVAADELDAATIAPMPAAVIPIVVSLFINWRRAIFPARTSSTIWGIVDSSSCIYLAFQNVFKYRGFFILYHAERVDAVTLSLKKRTESLYLVKFPQPGSNNFMFFRFSPCYVYVRK